MLSSVFDTVLDRSVIGGYTNLGYQLRRRAWDEADLRSMEGKVVLVTGASAGLGYAAARGFARLGATVHMLARNPSRGEDARAAVAQQATAGEVHLEICDLSRLPAVREFAAGFRRAVPRLDVLVNNAGVMSQQRQLSADGIELTLAVNVLAPFLLTAELLEPLRRAQPGRVVNVSSGGMYGQRLAIDDLQSERDYSATTAYARSKRAEVVLTGQWAARVDRSEVVFHSMHPGWADTPGVRSSLPRFRRLARPLLRTTAEGADTIVWLGAAPRAAADSGRFWHDRAPRPEHRLPRTRESAGERKRLWQECLRLTGAARDLTHSPATA
jgi:NAD(P)-dependent dehydrogenase (short-subunit alcohol dehydrogenase family)